MENAEKSRKNVGQHLATTFLLNEYTHGKTIYIKGIKRCWFDHILKVSKAAG